MCRFLSFAALVLALAGCSTPQGETGRSVSGDRAGYFGYGTPATPEQIAGWDIDIRPDGQGLPEGSGSVEDGEWLYEEQCASCHGSFGEGVDAYPVLAGGQDSLLDERPLKTIGSYWPYTSTLFDYIYRAMPFTQPESLSIDETYAITAYVLYLNELVQDDLVLTHENLASIRLPNEANFIADQRPDVAIFRCMSNCRDAAVIKVLSEAEAYLPETEPVAVAQDGADDGGRIYQQYCSLCHKDGIGGAPIVGEAGVWQTRIDAGLRSMIDNAITGMSSADGVMPAKGGFMHLSDDEVEAAVEYMLGASQ